MICSCMGPSHKLWFFMNCSSVGPLQGHKPCQQTCSIVGSCLHRSCQEPAPWWASHGVTASFRHPPALVWGPPWAVGGDLLPHGPLWLQGQPASPWSAPWLQGNFCSRAWSTFSHFFCTDLGVCRAIPLASSHSSLPLQIFPPLLHYGITEALPPLLVGSALASSRSILGPAGIDSVRHRGSFSQKSPP